MSTLGRTTTLDIRTPEGITFSLPLAGPVARGIAWGIDALFLFAIWVGVTMGMDKFMAAFGGYMIAVIYLAQLFITVGYGMVFEWLWRGQTLGKRLLRLRVMDERGLSLKPRQIVLRNLLRAIDTPIPLCAIVGGLAMVLSRRCQRLGDLVAGTVVVRSVKVPEPQIDELLASKFNSFQAHPHLEARLRQRIAPDQAQIVLQALLRRDELKPSRRVEVYRELAGHFRSLVDFPEEVTVGLTDEQYLRNVAETVFRKRAA